MSGCVYVFKHPLPEFCVGDHGFASRNFCVVARGVLWEGERPNVRLARWLLQHRVGSIVSIQVDDRRVFRATTVPPDLTRSVQYFHMRRFNAVRLFSRADLDERVASFVAIVRKAPKPIYVHCRIGVDRAVVLVAAYRVLIDGIGPDQAIREIKDLHSPWTSVEVRYLRSLTSARRISLMREVAGKEPLVQPDGEFRCGGGRCQYVESEKPAQQATRAPAAVPKGQLGRA